MLPYLLPSNWAWLTGMSRQPYVKQTPSITTSGCVASALTSNFWHAGGSLDQRLFCAACTHACAGGCERGRPCPVPQVSALLCAARLCSRPGCVTHVVLIMHAYVHQGCIHLREWNTT